MSLRSVRAGFLLLAGLIAGRLPDPDEPPKPVLQTLATDEADFRHCDRDWNQVNDSYYEVTSPTKPEVLDDERQ